MWQEDGMASSRYVLAFALCGAIMLMACRKKEESTQTATTSTTATTATVSATVAPPPATTSSAAPLAMPGVTPGTIASTDGEIAGSRVDITELKRTSGDTVNLKFVLVSGPEKAYNFHGHWLGDSEIATDTYRGISGVHLIDPVNKKKYFVVTDAEKHCLCSTNVQDIGPAEKVNLWAKFPAPPADVKMVTIEIPHFAPIDDVPIK
jgi:hypothetical protein